MNNVIFFEKPPTKFPGLNFKSSGDYWAAFFLILIASTALSIGFFGLYRNINANLNYLYIILYLIILLFGTIALYLLLYDVHYFIFHRRKIYKNVYCLDKIKLIFDHTAKYDKNYKNFTLFSGKLKGLRYKPKKTEKLKGVYKFYYPPSSILVCLKKVEKNKSVINSTNFFENCIESYICNSKLKSNFGKYCYDFEFNIYREARINAENFSWIIEVFEKKLNYEQNNVSNFLYSKNILSPESSIKYLPLITFTDDIQCKAILDGTDYCEKLLTQAYFGDESYLTKNKLFALKNYYDFTQNELEMVFTINFKILVDYAISSCWAYSNLGIGRYGSDGIHMLFENNLYLIIYSERASEQIIYMSSNFREVLEVYLCQNHMISSLIKGTEIFIEKIKKYASSNKLVV